ncbi:MAG: sporulation protein YqfD [Clostridia bacterium]|nr:sporulation protein YqfD [Clostridia bacterium]
MKNLCKVQITCSPVQALNKLKRADIPVYNCAKSGAYFTFEVADNYIKKVFAIFAHPCYNVSVKQNSAKKRAVKAFLSRPMLFIGAVLAVFCAALSNCFVLRISVTGSGSYLKNEVLAVVYSLGVTPYTFYRGIDEPSLRARVMALSGVTFCSVTKSGSVLYINVQADAESGTTADYASLCSDVNGTVIKITAVCGTALVSAGDSVAKGDVLIGAYCLNGEDKISCLAVGYAQLSVTASISVFAESDTEENLSSAYAAAMLYAEGEEITGKSVIVKTVADGVIYTVNFTYLHTISINFN